MTPKQRKDYEKHKEAFKTLKVKETTHHIVKNQAFKEGLTISDFVDLIAQERTIKKRGRKWTILN